MTPTEAGPPLPPQDREASPVTPSSPPSGPPRAAINAQWFARLRWVAAAGQLATIAFVSGPLGLDVPVAPLLGLVAVTLASNAFLTWWGSGRRESPTRGEWTGALAGVMLLDLVVLTAMLGLTGGTTNPFVVFYFVNLALSGVVLPGAWAWALSVLAILAFALLSVTHRGLDVLRDPARLESLAALRVGGDASPPVAVVGGGIAFATASIVIVGFTTRLTAELRESQHARRRAEKEAARAEKLEALGTLAAGAAHELGSPLSTIAVAVSEAHRELERSGYAGDAVQDLALVRREVGRCRTILDRMATRTGQPAAGLPERVTAEDLVDEVLADLAAANRIDVEWAAGAASLELVAPVLALAQAIRAVVQNGVDATDLRDPAGRVTVRADRLAQTLRLAVADRGPGMPAEVLARASEPFFTTKTPGRGMGLGLFLARSVVERLGGSLRLESPPGAGALVTIVLPLAPPRPT